MAGMTMKWQAMSIYWGTGSYPLQNQCIRLSLAYFVVVLTGGLFFSTPFGNAAEKVLPFVVGEEIEYSFRWEMIKAGKAIKGSEVLMLGVTFKEDCPDMRNTKVIDIIEELKDFGVNVDVYDPWVDHTEESEWYKHGIIKNPIESDKKYDAIVVAVGHKEFKQYTNNNYIKLSNGQKVIIDVKNIVKHPTWRL